MRRWKATKSKATVALGTIGQFSPSQYSAQTNCSRPSDLPCPTSKGILFSLGSGIAYVPHTTMSVKPWPRILIVEGAMNPERPSNVNGLESSAGAMRLVPEHITQSLPNSQPEPDTRTPYYVANICTFIISAPECVADADLAWSAYDRLLRSILASPPSSSGRSRVATPSTRSECRFHNS